MIGCIPSTSPGFRGAFVVPGLYLFLFFRFILLFAPMPLEKMDSSKSCRYSVSDIVDHREFLTSINE